MAYNRVGDTQDYNTFEDLIEDLRRHPDEMFVHHLDCEGLVYVSAFDEVIQIECKNVWGSAEMREEALNRKLNRMRKRGVLY